jgi:hypothetical protein
MELLQMKLQRIRLQIKLLQNKNLMGNDRASNYLLKQLAN